MAMSRKIEQKPWTRVEKDGRVAYVGGESGLLKVPSRESCRERLTKLLEEAGGDSLHPIALQFWNQRARDLVQADPMKAAWATEIYVLFDEVWEELTAPPAETDIFSAFGA